MNDNEKGARILSIRREQAEETPEPTGRMRYVWVCDCGSSCMKWEAFDGRIEPVCDFCGEIQTGLFDG